LQFLKKKRQAVSALLKEPAADFLVPDEDTLIKKGVFLHFRLKGTIKKGSWLL